MANGILLSWTVLCDDGMGLCTLNKNVVTQNYGHFRTILNVYRIMLYVTVKFVPPCVQCFVIMIFCLKDIYTVKKNWLWLNKSNDRFGMLKIEIIKD
jgi:hypothetical protein